MTKPIRIQKKRIKGFNLQKESLKINGLNAISVCRPSKWGNPFKQVQDIVYVDAGHRRKILDKLFS